MSFDRRVFALVVLVNALAIPAGIPYAHAILVQTPGTSLYERLPAGALVLLVLGMQLLVAVPAAALGVSIGPRLGLRTPLFSALAWRRPSEAPWRRIVRDGVLAGLALAAVVSAFGLVPWLRLDEELSRLSYEPMLPPAWAGLLGAFSAGVFEETITRLGLFTFVAAITASAARGWQAWTDATVPPPFVFHVANLVAALAFGALHFVNSDVIGLPITTRVVAVVLIGNGVVGLACGWLYWRRGLEAAMIAHTTVDVVIHGLLPAIAPGFGR